MLYPPPEPFDVGRCQTHRQNAIDMLEFEHERIPNRIGLLTAWLPRLAIAIVFVGVGSSKFRDPMWVRLFDRIGFGQWFRYLTGAMQIAGGLLTLVPPLSLVGIAMLACTMIGAVIVWFAFGLGLAAIVPGALLALLVVAGVAEYNRSRGN
jgi:putative oxidoreductase